MIIVRIPNKKTLNYQLFTYSTLNYRIWSTLNKWSWYFDLIMAPWVYLIEQNLKLRDVGVIVFLLYDIFARHKHITSNTQYCLKPTPLTKRRKSCSFKEHYN